MPVTPGKEGHMTIAAPTEPVDPPPLDDAERLPRRLRVLIADGDAFARRMMRDALQAAAEIVVIADVPARATRWS